MNIEPPPSTNTAFDWIWIKWLNNLYEYTRTSVSDASVTYDTWTPVVSDGTNDCTMTNQDGTVAYIGDMCFITCDITVNSIASASGAARITGLLDTADNISANHDYPLAVGEYSSLGVDVVPFAQVENNTAYITLHKWDQSGAGASAAMTIANVSNGGTLRLSGFYRKA